MQLLFSLCDRHKPDFVDMEHVCLLLFHLITCAIDLDINIDVKHIMGKMPLSYHISEIL